MNLDELKKALDQSNLSIQTCKKLMEQREDVHKHILLLKGQIETALLKMHRLKGKDPESVLNLEEEIKKKSEKLSVLKEKIKELDHLLDELGEEQDESLDRLKQQIISQIHDKFPESVSEYNLLEERLAAKRKEALNLRSQRESLSTFYDVLKEGAITQERRGFWNFLFGRHHKVMLAAAIHKAESEAKKIRKTISDKRIIEFLDHFTSETEKTWNHALYKGKYFEYFTEFKKLMETLDQELLDIQQSIIKIEKEIDKLIERYCRS